MGTLTRKLKGGKAYWYYVESARVGGKPRVVHQVYLGTAENVVRSLQEGTRPEPLRATARQFGLPAALWLEALDSGLWDSLLTVWPPRRRGPSVAHYLLLAALHRICAGGPKTEVAEWYAGTVLRRVWGFKPERFTSQAFWDAFEGIDQTVEFPADPLTRAQLAVVERWRARAVLGGSILAYDTTNFHTFIDTRNERCSLARRGINKQKRHDLRQVGMAYLADGASGLGLYHHVYPGNCPDVEEFSVSLPRMLAFLEHAGLDRTQVTLVFDKGPADLVNVTQLEDLCLGWVAPVPWSEVPESLRVLPEERLEACPPALPGVRAALVPCDVWGATRRCVVVQSSVFAGEQMHSLMDAVAKAASGLRALARDLAKPRQRPWTESGIRDRLATLLAGQWLKDIVRISALAPAPDRTWHLQFHVDNGALSDILQHRAGRTVIATNRTSWSAAQIIQAYHRQSVAEHEFRDIKDGGCCPWGPMFHWTDDNIRIHAFYTMLGMSLLNGLCLRLRQANLPLNREHLIAELAGMQEIALVYPRPGQRGSYPTAKIVTHQTLDQKHIGAILNLDRLRNGRRG